MTKSLKRNPDYCFNITRYFVHYLHTRTSETTRNKLNDENILL